MSILQDVYGPDWPIGWTELVVAGIPVQITSVIDATNINSPETPSQAGAREYTTLFNQIIFQAFKKNFKGHGLVLNDRNIYIVRKGGSRDDPGTIIFVLEPGETKILSTPKTVNNAYSPYRYYLDGDHDNDGVLVTGLVF